MECTSSHACSWIQWTFFQGYKLQVYILIYVENICNFVLFLKAIAQSGAFVGGDALRPDTELIQTEKGQIVVDSANCNFNTGDKDAILACLQSLSAIDLLAIPALPRGMKLIFSFQCSFFIFQIPVLFFFDHFIAGAIDGSFSLDPILPEDPETLFRNGKFHQVPLIIGNTDAEGILLADPIFGGAHLPAIGTVLGSAIKNLGLFSKRPGDFTMETMDF